jgi:hypothetical protein
VIKKLSLWDFKISLLFQYITAVIFSLLIITESDIEFGWKFASLLVSVFIFAVLGISCLQHGFPFDACMSTADI